jgi:hypothetical protein
LLPFPEYRQAPCICFASVLEPSSLTPHSDVTSPHCPVLRWANWRAWSTWLSSHERGQVERKSCVVTVGGNWVHELWRNRSSQHKKCLMPTPHFRTRFSSVCGGQSRTQVLRRRGTHIK